ncbi:hypothetical protein VVT58_13530 [Sphingobium sp. SJ10-10]|uniref:hypothetical protein n=1 Tax=Sphingobium sp. SJ10-10 TaxID=3114999 RepID=UPI002E1805EE|nr:hypothetical protein [Sphingobium sp. SJ10-10]
MAKLFVQQWHAADEVSLQARGDGFAIPSRHFWEEKLSNYVCGQGESDTDAIMEEWTDRAEQLLKAQRFVRNLEDALGFERLCKPLKAAVADWLQLLGQRPEAPSFSAGLAAP